MVYQATIVPSQSSRFFTFGQKGFATMRPWVPLLWRKPEKNGHRFAKLHSMKLACFRPWQIDLLLAPQKWKTPSNPLIFRIDLAVIVWGVYYMLDLPPEPHPGGDGCTGWGGVNCSFMTPINSYQWPTTHPSCVEKKGWIMINIHLGPVTGALRIRTNWYIYMHLTWNSTIHVGKYTNPMDP